MRILIAEDDPATRTLLGSVLQGGHKAIETIPGGEAWDAMQQPDAPSLDILDWMMSEKLKLPVRLSQDQHDDPL